MKRYRKSNKNDFLDAEAIAEAVTKQNMRFVQLKTQEQLDWQAMHRVRDRLVQRRTALINQSTVVGAGDQESPEAFRITAKEGLSEHPKAAICEHLKSGHTLEKKRPGH